MCDKAIRNDHLSVQFVTDWFVPDWFVTQQRIKNLRDNINDWYLISLLSAMMAIKNERPKKHKLKKI